MLGILFIPTIVLLIRTAFVKEKCFILAITSLLLLGEVAGVLVAYYAYDTMKIAADLKLLLWTAKNDPHSIIL